MYEGNFLKGILCAVLCFCAASAFAVDFGGLITVSPEGDDGDAVFTLKVQPWLQALFPDTSVKDMELYVSAILGYKYDGTESDQKWNHGWIGKKAPTVEAGRFDFSFKPGSKLSVAIGRSNVSDPLGVIASGLFDGAGFSWTMSKGTLSGGVYYTGLLYKRSAEIIMTESDEAEYEDNKTYRAPSRLFGTANWNMPLSDKYTLTAGALFQVDFRRDDYAHTFYGYGSFGATLPAGFSVNAGAVAEVVKNPDWGFAWELNTTLGWLVPGSLQDRLSLSAFWFSGDNGGSTTPFLPISVVGVDSVLTARQSGIATLNLDYILRIIRSLSAEATFSYLFRTDDSTFLYKDMKGDAGSLLGPEFFARLMWSPISDLSLNAGAGALFPGGGDYFDRSSPIWKVSVSMILSL